MTYRELDSVVLIRDLPEHELRSGDIGTIVHAHDASTFEVEFLVASGDTSALVELTSADLRPPTEHDQISVRIRTAAPLGA